MAYILFTGLILLFIVSVGISKKMTGRYLSPFTAFPASFLMSAVVYLIDKDNFYEMPGWGVVTILSGVGLFELGAIVGGPRKSVPKTCRGCVMVVPQRRQERNLFCFLSLLLILGLVGALYQLSVLINTAGLPLLTIYTDYFYLIDHGFLLSGWAWLYCLNMLNLPLCTIYFIRYRRRRSIVLFFGIISAGLLVLKGDAYYIFIPVLSALVALIFEKPRRQEIKILILALFSASVSAILFFMIIKFRQEDLAA